jgi:hypothetical protein
VVVVLLLEVLVWAQKLTNAFSLSFSLFPFHTWSCFVFIFSSLLLLLLLADAPWFFLSGGSASPSPPLPSREASPSTSTHVGGEAGNPQSSVGGTVWGRDFDDPPLLVDVDHAHVAARHDRPQRVPEPCHGLFGKVGRGAPHPVVTGTCLLLVGTTLLFFAASRRPVLVLSPGGVQGKANVVLGRRQGEIFGHEGVEAFVLLLLPGTSGGSRLRGGGRKLGHEAVKACNFVVAFSQAQALSSSLHHVMGVWGLVLVGQSFVVAFVLSGYLITFLDRKCKRK